MFKVGDRIFITRGSHQNETGVVTATDDWSGALTVLLDGWPGDYNINPEACIRVVSADTELVVIADGLDNILDGLPTWTH